MNRLKELMEIIGFTESDITLDYQVNMIDL